MANRTRCQLSTLFGGCSIDSYNVSPYTCCGHHTLAVVKVLIIYSLQTSSNSFDQMFGKFIIQSHVDLYNIHCLEVPFICSLKWHKNDYITLCHYISGIMKGDVAKYMYWLCMSGIFGALAIMLFHNSYNNTDISIHPFFFILKLATQLR